jgi:hypothetical protein
VRTQETEDATERIPVNRQAAGYIANWDRRTIDAVRHAKVGCDVQ